ncbi:uncharacterized protein GGS22DRAFT_19552 [Annulohypoxylon maeteangense]|uniref:uncharacterized protein n=1 Tax=Annulohypoxylon maeteangense TaxID=1927788 RepID=UPI0020089344|nr:uncharacterized protein GGS22DRAFT_19552 [Annulohypoxylon maeteangense]KAI0884141.1 hypothetical protein GGS22DRAFT_19552 [Annulohypoxylon maeteangense]
MYVCTVFCIVLYLPAYLHISRAVYTTRSMIRIQCFSTALHLYSKPGQFRSIFLNDSIRQSDMHSNHGFHGYAA